MLVICSYVDSLPSQIAVKTNISIVMKTVYGYTHWLPHITHVCGVCGMRVLCIRKLGKGRGDLAHLCRIDLPLTGHSRRKLLEASLLRTLEELSGIL